ncbi:hypothetical protein [Acidovorax sp. NCPPB 3576]|uniref:hypothetical protein n=1 Tax=Acidovorax sp. NCPPB 3576 TaxID=2940488 RepID=UPI00234A349C|nr:hypothetical protein [Acidovorax sp. NCPPB 3576]WCM90611.1 hypothetical protein M5C98_11595 [Acidovorax sp. NCPPB 3576]
MRFTSSVADTARLLAKWQAGAGGLLVPIAFPLPKAAEEKPAKGVSFYRERAKQVRSQIAKELGLEPSAAAKLSFTMTSKDAWYLGPRPKLDLQLMLDAVASTPAKFIELMLLKELIESASFDSEDTFVGGGFGPGVYLGSMSQASKKFLHLAEAEFTVNAKHGLLLCGVTAKRFGRKATAAAEEAAVTKLANAGEGYLVGVTRIVPEDFYEHDARKSPMEGLSLDRDKVRRTRLYYLNLLTEFAIRLFTKAGVPFERETFVASHCVDDAYIPLEPLANLQRPLMVVNTTVDPLDHDALAPLTRFPEYLPGYHVAGNKKTHFPAPSVQVAEAVPTALDPALNYLFLNGKGDEDLGSVRLAKSSATPDFQPVKTQVAYAALSRGDGTADPYTEAKFRHLLAKAGVSIAMQGLDYSPKALAALRPGKADDAGGRQLQEALKRCLVELSLKEVLLGKKVVKVPAMPPGMPTQLTLLASRRVRMPGRQSPEQLVAAVDVQAEGDSLSIIRVRRTPWGDSSALLDLVFEFPFLQENGKDWVRDGQFWVVDSNSGERLTVWSGNFVPKIILNDAYEGIEHAIAAQDAHQAAQKAEGSPGRFLSKGREFNILPYYISMFKPAHGKHGERVGLRMPVQDCATFVRVFVPPEGGISGSGDALSGMRDLMHYGAGGAQTIAGMLDLPLVQMYLHTMTNGVLVGGDNSKMSLFEKLAKLALEN